MPSLIRRTETESEAARSAREFEATMLARETGSPYLPTPLDAPETTPDAPPYPEGHGVKASHPLDIQSTFQRQAHAQHREARFKIVSALFEPSGDDKLRQRSQQMGCCCCLPSFRIDSNGKPLASLARCRDRLCPLCADRRGRQATARTIEVVKRFNAPRFITLTLKHRDATLKAELKRLHEALQKLRGDKAWTKRVFGGVYGVEVTRNTKARQWHVHVHLICDGEFFPHEVLKALWLACTGDSFIVDIAIVKDRAKTARYISRYVSKPVDVQTWAASEIREYATAMHGRRLLQTFGNAHNAQVDADVPEVDHATTSPLCSSMKLMSAVSAGSKHAAEAARIIGSLGFDYAVAANVPHIVCMPRVQATPEQLAWAIRVLKAVDACQTAIATDRLIRDLICEPGDADNHIAASVTYYQPSPGLAVTEG